MHSHSYTASMPESVDLVVVVPIRSFRSGKGRLAGVLSQTERAALSTTLASRVLDAVFDLPTIVVTSDDDVRSFANARGVAVIDDPGSLNAAAEAGRLAALERGAAFVAIAHADLARPTPFGWVADFDGVTIVPDRHGTGTNVLCLPAATEFVFAYGDGSRARHEREAARIGLPVRVVADASLGWDVDEPDDLVGAWEHATEL